MAEFAASIAGLVTTAEVVFGRIYKYVKHVKKAKQEVLELLTEVNGLCGTLHSIELLSEGLEHRQNAHVLCDAVLIASCATVLDRLRERLAKLHQSSDKTPGSVVPNGDVQAKWKWPFSRSETLELKAKLETYKSTLSLQLTADGIASTLDVLDKTDEISQSVRGIEEMLKAQCRVKLDTDKELSLSAVGPCQPLQRHKMNTSLRYPGTGVWFTVGESLQQWLQGVQPRLWVHGIPGAGKTVLAAAAIAEMLKHSDAQIAAAYFYCDFKDADTQQPLKILGALIEQIARQSERSLERVLEFVRQRSRNGKPQTFACSCDDLCDLIIELSSHYHRLRIAIDGIDECGSSVRELMGYIERLGNDSARISIFISSRDLPDIRDFVDSFEPLSIAAQSIDLRIFVGAEMAERTKKTSPKRLYLADPSLKEEIMDRLIDGAEGMFRWVAVQLDYICEQASDAEIRTALASLPPDLFSSYERLLHMNRRKPRASQEIVQQVVKWLVWVGPMRADALGEMLSLRANTRRLDETAFVQEAQILKLCGSFIRKEKNGATLELAHFTVKEFFLTINDRLPAEISLYALHKDSDGESIATTMLTYLCCEDFAAPNFEHDSMAFVQQDHAEYLYPHHPLRLYTLAAMAWSRTHLDSTRVLDLLKTFFGHSRHHARRFYFLERGADQSAFAYQRITRRNTKDYLAEVKFITALHHACIERLPPLCDWLLQGETDVNSDSPIGTPIHCALLGRLGYTVLTTEATLQPNEWLSSRGDRAELNSIIRALLQAGTDFKDWFHFGNNSDNSQSIQWLFVQNAEGFEPGTAAAIADAGAKYDRQSLGLIRYRIMTNSEDVALHEFVQGIQPSHLQMGLESDHDELMVFVDSLSNLKRTKVPYCKPGSQRITEDAMRGYMKFATVHEIVDIMETVGHLGWRSDDGKTMLHLAGWANREDVIEILLEQGHPLEVRCYHDETPLLAAMSNGTPRLINSLLSKGADAFAITKGQNNIWHCAVIDGNSEAFRLLRDVSEDVRLLINDRNHLGATAMNLACHAPDADADIIEYLIDAGADQTMKDNLGWSPIQYAVQFGRLDIIKLLLKNRSGWSERSNCQTGSRIWYDLKLTHLAAFNGHTECLQLLLTLTNDFNINDIARDWNLLHFAAHGSHLSTLTYLVNAGCRSIKTNQGYNPLHIAASAGDEDCTEFLLNQGYSPLATTANGYTPALLAVNNDNARVAQILRRAQVQAVSGRQSAAASGKTGDLRKTRMVEFWLSIKQGDTPACEQLVDEDRSLLLSLDTCGCSPVIVALSYGQSDIAMLLIDKGVSLTGTTCKTSSYPGYTALHYCARFEYRSVLHQILDREPGLLFATPQVHPIHIAVLNGSNQSLETMLERAEGGWEKVRGETSSLAWRISSPKASISDSKCPNHYLQRFSLVGPRDLLDVSMDVPLSFPWNLANQSAGTTRASNPLQIAALTSNTKAVKLLLHYGAPVDGTTERDICTPLIHALYQYEADRTIIDLLLEHGASMASCDRGGRSCADIAISRRISIPVVCKSQVRKYDACERDLAYYRNNLLGNFVKDADGVDLSRFDHGGASLGQTLAKSIVCRSWLLNYGDNFSGGNESFGSILHYSWFERDALFLKCLFKKLGKYESQRLLNYKPRQRNTPLYYAAIDQQIQVMEIMVQNGAELDLKGGIEGPPLMVAAAFGRFKAVKWLVQQGASTVYLDLETQESISVLEKAKWFPEIVRWLLVERWCAVRAITWPVCALGNSSGAVPIEEAG